MFTVLLNRKVMTVMTEADTVDEELVRRYGNPKIGTVVAVHSCNNLLHLTAAFDDAPLITAQARWFKLLPIENAPCQPSQF